MGSKKYKHRKKFEENWMEELSHDHQHHYHMDENRHHCHQHHFDENKHHCHDEHDKDGKDDKNCICSIVRRILKAQEEVDECQCEVSCERSIRQMLAPNDCPPANTVPFTLTCGCDLFFGKTVIYDKHGLFCLISSPFFKVKKVDHNCCAVLELLWPTCNGEPHNGPLKCPDHNSFLCCNFSGFIGTGACITVDLSCFCGISCLKPHMVDEATANQIHQIIKCHKN
ncbi:CotY/CotZ family spore coat protein [Schinkia azotoformans]|uniref:CotY/CotZ family spore coat protein n=1 Tax=Schinkia azotoformans TaxID=1454 RepID=UPI002DB6AA73|nr:CotY/CotZ family spore coat protein [Schinkia azotoformans]MEC1769904.1 CotY/CotZ family spore coat protein [Schinkia azotoformans]MED4367184.1 CotY/CotZ family spore coat protein [Schinkia azotoformans]